MTSHTPTRSPQPSQPARILLVAFDDDRRGQLLDWLSSAGYDCRVLDDLASAALALRHEPTSAALLDLHNSPGRPARMIAALGEAARTSRLPIIATGTDLDADARARLLRGGADEALRLDVPNDELTLRLEAMLRRQETRDQFRRMRVTLQDDLARHRRAIRKLRRRNRLLKRRAATDSLTGIFDGRYFRRWLGTQFEIAQRHNLLLTVLMIDVDHFKQINDNCGHPFGDYVLKQFASILSSQVRSSDVVARNGGDEFVIGLVETSRAEAVRFSRRLLRAVASHSFEYFGQTETMTISVGMASFPEDSAVRRADQLILFADHALYHAKDEGRNTLAAWHELDPDTRRRLSSSISSSDGPAVSAKPTLDLPDVD
jgi:diguanylate cyclase (GGDEF)-like protein